MCDGNLLRRIGKRLLIGGGFEFDHHFGIEMDSGIYNGNRIYEDSLGKNTTSSGAVIKILYDSRRNSINPQGGWYLSLETRFNQTAFGSDKNWNQLYVDVRKYFSFSKTRQNKLALWSYLWTVLYGRAPYLDLPSIGWDPYGRSGRGFLQNRYRSNALLYFESEYRRDITRDGLLGFVLFANLHSVTEYRTSTFVYWHPAGGAGLRFKLNKYSGTNITLDYGISKTYNGIYLNISETF